MNNKKIIFIGNPVPKDATKHDKILNFNIADNIAQMTLIEGLHKSTKETLL